jgi:hypothetical protein
MYLYLFIKVVNIQSNENIKMRTNGGADVDHVQLRYHCVVITYQRPAQDRAAPIIFVYAFKAGISFFNENFDFMYTYIDV